MKALSLSLLLALGLVAAVGCAAPASEEGDVKGEETEAVQTDEAALISTSSSGGLGWSAKCKACKDKCDADYPSGGGPLQTCKQLCVLAGTCTSTSGPGVIGAVRY